MNELEYPFDGKYINTVFREVFDDETISVGEATTADDIEERDSLTHIGLISDVEDEFDIHFRMKDVIKMNNVGELADRIFELVE